MDNYNETDGGISIADIFALVKRYCVVMLAIIVAACAAGFVFSKLRTPKYTATATLTYNVSIENSKNTTAEASAQLAYYETMKEFCTAGIVMDRANYYFEKYLKSAEYINGDLNGFIEKTKTESNNYDYKKIKTVVFSTDNVSVKSASSASMSNFVLSVTSTSEDDVTPMLRLYSLAVNVEAKSVIDGYIQEISESGITAPQKDMSTLKLLIISGIVGVCLACVAVYLLWVTDKTVRDEGELDKITGVHLLSKIANAEE